jgi:NAD(P)-dependent dehydrogenase (short-subunit alcohol dehydrogenase family)
MARRALRYFEKVAIVTGGSRGIGEGIVRSFLQEGGRVVFCGRPSDPGDSLAASLNSDYPGSAFHMVADARKSSDLDAVFKACMKTYGRLDTLVNNVGTHPLASPIEGFTVDDFRSLLELNLVSYWYMTRACIVELRRTQGSVINVSSLSGHFGQAGASTYCATKGAITAMTRSLAIDEAKHDVRVNSISPGNIWTPLWEEHVAGPHAAQLVRAGREEQLLGRMGTPAEVREGGGWVGGWGEGWVSCL